MTTATTGGGGVSGGGAEIRGLGEAAVEVVVDVQRRRRHKAGFVGGLSEAAAEELEGMVVVRAEGEKRVFLFCFILFFILCGMMMMMMMMM